MKILAIIPARCGSKGIKDKNIIDICGKPLISYSIEQGIELKKLGLIDRIIVSTDCQKISDIAIEYGAEVPFLRPKDISGDQAKSVDFCIHAINFFSNIGIEFDAILLLQPTSPIRNLKLLKSAINSFSNNFNNSLISVYREYYINELVMYSLLNEKELIGVTKNHNKGIRRQDHKEVFVRNGSVYIARVPYIKKNRSLISDNPLFVEMSKKESINIDTVDDLKMIRALLCK